MRFSWQLAFLLFALPSAGQWQLGVNCGVPGGIPNRQTVYTNFSPGATAAMINSGCDNCPSNQVVKLAPGTYSGLNGAIIIRTSGVTLRGAGISNTIIVPDNPAPLNVIFIGIDASETAGTAISSGWAVGASNLTVASTAGIAVGDLVRCDEVMDTAVMWDKFNDGAARQINHMGQVMAINGSVVTIWPPLYYPLTSSPKMYHYNSYKVQMSGVENLTVDSTGNTTTAWGIFMEQSIGCWVTNVQTIKINNYHHYGYRNVFREITHCRLDWASDFLPNHGGLVAGNGSGTYCDTGWAFYNNIVDSILPCVEINGGSSGGICAYNYLRDPRYDDTAQTGGMVINHGPCCVSNLYEGNIVNAAKSDGYFGGSLYDTIFRNWLTGWTETFTNFNSRPVTLARWALYATVMGNVLGVTNFTPDLLCYLPATTTKTNDSPAYQTSEIYCLGNPDADATSTFTNSRAPFSDRAYCFDMNVSNTALIHGNWDSYTKTQRWDPAVADHSMPDSRYLSGKPTWFGVLAWPPFDPAKGYTNLWWPSIPAGYLYVNGVDPPQDSPQVTTVVNWGNVRIGNMKIGP